MCWCSVRSVVVQKVVVCGLHVPIRQVTLLGFTLVPSEKEHTVFDDIFDTLLQCSTISFRKCSCQASTLLLGFDMTEK